MTASGLRSQRFVPTSIHSAVTALGWRGTAVRKMTILSARVYPVISFHHAAHAHRVATGQRPMLDLDVLETWDWPETDDRAPEVVRLHGVIGASRSWRRALNAAERLDGFCAGAILVNHMGSDDLRLCEMECALTDTALVQQAGEGAEVRIPGRPGRCVGARRRTFDRWVEELIYKQTLDATVIHNIQEEAA